MTVIVGTNGTGKSTVALHILKALNVPRKLVLTRQLEEWDEYPINELLNPADFRFRGINRHIPVNISQTLEKLHYLRNCALLFDDARKYLTAKTDDELNALYISRRQYAMHIIFIAHSFDQVPVQAYSFATDFILFKTVKQIDRGRLAQLNEPEKFIEAKNRVDREAITNHHYFERIKI
ncbi:MAG: ATP-binding protein [Prolixibacteraceae bacterium]|nr:ATP-binding protein [Prolixibacteraceae bacterium]